MYNLFVFGKAFTYQSFIPTQLYEKDVTGKTILHYAAAGGVPLSSPIVR